MPSSTRSSSISLTAVSALALILAACSGDDGGATSDGVSSDASTTQDMTQGSTSSTGGSSGSGGDASSSGSAGATSSSTGDATTGDATAGTTGGGAEDPNYPSPGDVGCAGETAPIMLPGGAVCAPFCDGPGGACPAPADGDAMPVCAPFENGGSMAPCGGDGECAGSEVCWDGSCIEVAFWACNIDCSGGETCPSGMSCIAGLCAYPF